MSLSIIVPAFNEEKIIQKTLSGLLSAFKDEEIEILVVDDFSQDSTASKVLEIQKVDDRTKLVKNQNKKGFAGAIVQGIERSQKEFLAIVMGDGSEDPKDVLAFYKKAQSGYDCVFGSRFQDGGITIDYPPIKLFINRCFNRLLKLVFRIDYDDFSNAFKLYRTSVAKEMLPLKGSGFSVSPELCLKCVIANRKYCVLPNSWKERSAGRSKFNIMKEFVFYNMVLIRMAFNKYSGGLR